VLFAEIQQFVINIFKNTYIRKTFRTGKASRRHAEGKINKANWYGKTGLLARRLRNPFRYTGEAGRSFAQFLWQHTQGY